MPSHLENCPFCGGGRIETSYIRDGRSIGCRDCGASLRQFNGLSDINERLAKAWNRRSAPTPPAAEGDAVTLTYTNWRGETAERSIIPRGVWFGATEWHPEPQWLLRAFDVEKQADRDFALKDFGTPPAAEAPGQEPVAVRINRLIDAIEGECDGLAVDYETAKVILLHAMYGADPSDIRAGIVSTPPTYADAEAKGCAAPSVEDVEKMILATEPIGDEDAIWTRRMAIALHAAIRSLASPAPKGET